MGSWNSPWARYGLAAAVFVGVGFSVWCAERLLEARDPGLLWRDPRSGDDGLKFYQFHPELGLFHKPSFSGTYQGTRYTQNSLGLRGADVGYARTPERARVVLLGDSVAWGFGVPDGETVADHLARAWTPTEVVNVAVAGFGTGQELMLLRHEGLRYQPDLVVLMFTVGNDVEDTYFPDSADSYPANLFHLVDGELQVDRFEISGLDRLGLWLRHNSYIVGWAANRTAAEAPHGDGQSQPARAEPSAIGRANLARHAANEPDLARYARLSYLRPQEGEDTPRYARRGGLLPPDPRSHYKVELVKQLLLEIERTTREAGALFAVALAPFAAQTGEADLQNPLHTELVRFLTHAGIQVVDLLPMLRASGLANAALYADSMHFSPEGNRVVAELLASALQNPTE